MSSFNPEHRRALELLAEDGATEAILLANGVKPQTIAALVDAELATMQIDHMRAGARPIDVFRISITDAGRRLR